MALTAGLSKNFRREYSPLAAGVAVAPALGGRGLWQLRLCDLVKVGLGAVAGLTRRRVQVTGGAPPRGARL
jgi:hypothetical protein